MAKTIKWKPGRGTSWREKLERVLPGHGKVVPVPAGGWGGGREGQSMLIPRPLDVDAVMRRIRKGRLITVSQVRAHLAIARRGSFRAAARDLGVAEPTLHRVARDLETVVEVKLYRRTPQGFSATPAALRFADRLRLA